MELSIQRLEAVLKGHTGAVLSVALTSDDQYIVSGGQDNNLIIWNLQYRRQEALLEGHNHVEAVAI